MDNEIKFVTVDDVEYEMKNIPYAKILDMARDMVGDIVVCDEDTGTVFERYDKEARIRYWVLKYFTDYPLTGEEDREWILSLVDRMRLSNGAECVEYELPDHLYDAYRLLYQAVEKKFNGRNSLSTKLMKMFGSILADEDITKTIAESRNMSENLLDLMQKAKLFDENQRDVDSRNKKQTQNYLQSFAKKNIN